MDTLNACEAALKAYDGQSDLTTEIRFTAMITCSGSGACAINLTGTQLPPSASIIGDPTQDPSAVGLRRIDHFSYSLIHVSGWSNVTLSNFSIDEAPSDTSMLILGSDGALFCGAPDPSSTVTDPRVLGTTFISAYQAASCSVPGYVTTLGTNANGDPLYIDSNTECFNNNPGHICSDPIVIDGGSNDITLSGLTIDHAQGQAVWVNNATGFYLLNSTIMNSFSQALLLNATDVSIEGNTFFANRAAAIHGTIITSQAKRPSDISDNIFNHNQHGDAFGSGGHEGVSGAQISINSSWNDLAFYGNTFLNGYMDFYDPQVFDEQIGSTDPFSQCELSVRCIYIPSSGGLTTAGTLWTNGGGVESGPNAHGNEGTSTHMVPAVDVDAALGAHVVFSNNRLNYGSGGVINYTGGSISNPKLMFLYRNQIFQNTSVIDPVAWPNSVESGECTTNTCNTTLNDTSPDIVDAIQVSPAHTTGTDDDAQDCGGKNCITVLATGAWQEGYNSLALGTGTNIRCALGVYDTTGTLISTLQNSNAHCNAGGGLFYVPGSVAEHYTDVKVSFENLSTGANSPQVAMTWTGMVPTITGAGTGCSNNQCIWITVTDPDTNGNCAVGLYNPNTLALIMTLSNSQVNCNSDGVTFVIPSSILANYNAVTVNYQNKTQGTWSTLRKVTFPVSGGGSGGGDPGTGNQ